MVLFAPIIKKRMEEKARKEERRQNNAAWDAWLKRRDEAQANGQLFDEPSPSQDSGKNNDP
jgi:hypothetical protein